MVALSADGTTALIGAPQKIVAGHRWQGAVYVFVRSGSTWRQQQELTAPDGTTDDQFGWSVALSTDGNTALIGDAFKTMGRNRDQGAAYVFVRGGSSWSPQQRLTAADGARGAFFGDTVALSGDGRTALSAGTHGVLRAAYVFVRRRGAWSQQQEFAPSVRAVNDGFGDAVALSADGTTSLIGADDRNVGSKSRQGTAYVFGPRTQAAATATNRAG